MTETTPEPGKTRITIEIDTADFESGNYDLNEFQFDRCTGIVHGPDPEDPSDKCNRLLEEAEEKFRLTRTKFPHGTPYDVGQCLAEGAELLAQALKVFREEL